MQDGADRPPLGRAFLAAVPALLVPVVMIGSIYTGVFTPTKAAATAVFAALVIGFGGHREPSVRALPRIRTQTVVATAAIMLVIAAAALVSCLILRSGLPQEMAGWFRSLFETRWAFLLAVHVLLVVGMFVATSATVPILAPLPAPVAISYGVDPVHFGLIVAVNLVPGMITPPLGVNLFAACAVARSPLEAIVPQLLWSVVTIFACQMPVPCIPAITLGPMPFLLSLR